MSSASLRFFGCIFCFSLFSACVKQTPPPPVSSLPIKDVTEDKIKELIQEEEKETAPKHEITKDVSPAGLKTVRVGLKPSVESATISCDGSFEGRENSSKSVQRFPAGTYEIKSRSGKIIVGSNVLGKEVKFTPASPSRPMRSGSMDVRGSLLAVVVNGSQFSVINELDVDSYLKGVLPREVIVTWPKEALKVQAVASRTYMASHMGRHNLEGFDICSEVHCQVYGGSSRENPNTNQAVEETKGQILVFEGKPIGAFFHANCGGMTEQIQPVWGSSNLPYLPAKICRWGTEAPWYNWSKEFSFDTILEDLKKKKLVEGSALRSLSVKKKSHSGRTESVVIETNKGSFTLSGNAFRLALHPEKVRSTLWTSLRKSSKGYQIEGKGWGHGVGLCQWGARGQASAGKGYREILEFYFPHTKLVVWKE